MEEGLSDNLQGPALELGSYLQAIASTFRSRSEQGLAWASEVQVAAGTVGLSEGFVGGRGLRN